MENRTIYFEHYFHGEHDLRKLLEKSYAEIKYENRPRIHLEIDSETLTNLGELGVINPEAVKDAVLAKWGLQLEDYNDGTVDGIFLGTNILALNIPEGIQLPMLKEHLYNIAIDLMDDSSGDDDFYDYTPGTVESIAYLLLQLGYPTESENLIEELEERGHRD
jgi:hypothetical protein